MKRMNPAPPMRDEALPHDAIGPGLYPDEVAFELPDGDFVAVSADARWMAGNAGVSIKTWVRWIGEDGSTRLSSTGDGVEIDIVDTFDAAFVEQFGIDALTREKLKAHLGEQPATYTVPGSQEERPIYDPSPQVRAAIDINRAIGLVRAAQGRMDAGGLLEMSS